MRILLAVLLALSAVSPAAAWTQRESCPPEALTVLRWEAGLLVPCVPLDANGDGQISSVDALWILKGLGEN